VSSCPLFADVSCTFVAEAVNFPPSSVQRAALIEGFGGTDIQPEEGFQGQTATFVHHLLLPLLYLPPTAKPVARLIETRDKENRAC
jgi:hypothetical protein